MNFMRLQKRGDIPKLHDHFRFFSILYFFSSPSSELIGISEDPFVRSPVPLLEDQTGFSRWFAVYISYNQKNQNLITHHSCIAASFLQQHLKNLSYDNHGPSIVVRNNHDPITPSAPHLSPRTNDFPFDRTASKSCKLQTLLIGRGRPGAAGMDSGFTSLIFISFLQ
jgi:hypothetical protein